MNIEQDTIKERYATFDKAHEQMKELLETVKLLQAEKEELTGEAKRLKALAGHYKQVVDALNLASLSYGKIKQILVHARKLLEPGEEESDEIT